MNILEKYGLTSLQNTWHFKLILSEHQILFYRSAALYNDTSDDDHEANDSKWQRWWLIVMAPGAQINSPLPTMGSEDPPIPTPAPLPVPTSKSSSSSEPLRGLKRYKMINLVGDGTYGLVYLAFNQVRSFISILTLMIILMICRKREKKLQSRQWRESITVGARWWIWGKWNLWRN